MHTLAGLATARGLAVGPVFIYHGDGDVAIPEYVVAEGCEQDELLRLRHAQIAAKRDLEGLVAALRDRSDCDENIFECHLMFLEDALLIGETEKYILEGHLNAEAAVHKTANHARSQFDGMNDPYFRERKRDIDDVERRLQLALSGFGGALRVDLRTPSIIVADDLTPSEAIQLPREYVLAFATNGGSTTSHVALLARSMGIPAVTGLGNITSSVSAGEIILVDGTSGIVTISPNDAAISEYRNLIKRQRELANIVDLGATAGKLKDGGDVPLYANLHPGLIFNDAHKYGARGVGLYRSEYLWLNQEHEPSEEDQFAAYREIAEFASTLGDVAPVAIRVLDIGGDKLVRGISTVEANPFMGNRSIRYLLSNREVFRTQLRAILRASAFGNVSIIYPMISCIEELRAAQDVLNSVRSQLDKEHIPYNRNIKTGAMIEVPAAAVNANALAKYVDYFSIGTNDLVQYSMAADRGNESVSHLYQPTNPGIIKLVEMTISAAKANGIRVGICGESASDPIVGVLWAAMGADLLSMSATYIPLIARILSNLTRQDLDEYLSVARTAGESGTAKEVYDTCQSWLDAKLPDAVSMLA